MLLHTFALGMKPLSVDTGDGAPIVAPAVEETQSSSSYDDSPHHLLTQTDRFGVQSPHATKQKSSPAPRSPRGSGPDMPRSPRGVAPSNSGGFPTAPAVPSTSLLERLFCCVCAASNMPHTGPTTTPLVSTNGAAAEGLLGPIAAADTNKMCLVLDLDETLVHSSFRPIPNPDFVLPVEIDGACSRRARALSVLAPSPSPSRRRVAVPRCADSRRFFCRACSLSISTYIRTARAAGTVHHVYVLKRPGVDEFLIECAKLFEIVVYTASLSKVSPALSLLLRVHALASLLAHTARSLQCPRCPPPSLAVR